MKNELNQNTTDYYQWIASIGCQGMGYVFMDVISHPFLTIWTIQQSEKVTLSNAIKQTRQGVGLYAGFSMQALSSLPGTFCYMQGRQLSLDVFGDNSVGHVMQGPLGVAGGTLVWSPAARLSMLQQVAGNSVCKNTFSQLSLPQKINFIRKEQGIRGFYRGALPYALSFSFTDAIGSWIQAHSLQLFLREDRQKLLPQMLTTIFAFTIAAFMSSPIEVGIARIKIAETNPKVFTDKHFISAMRTIYRQNGYRGFFIGLPAWIAHSVVWHTVLPIKAVVEDRVMRNTC